MTIEQQIEAEARRMHANGLTMGAAYQYARHSAHNRAALLQIRELQAAARRNTQVLETGGAQ